MKKAEAIVAAGVLALGGWIMFEANRMPYLVEGVPGPGFLPLWLALGILGTGLILLWQAIRPGIRIADVIAWPDATGWRNVGLVLGSLVAALLLLQPLGFLLTVTLFMAVVIFFLGIRSWITVICAPLLASIVLYLVFAVFLQVPLPKGVLAFFE